MPEERPNASGARIAPDAAAWALLLAAVALLYAPVLRFFWAADDTQILKTALTRNPAELLFSPRVYRAFSPFFFFPSLVLSFDVDHALFGLKTSGYFAHQLLVLWLAGGALYALLARFLTRGPALAAAALFLIGPVTPLVASELMLRHYVEGLLLALVAALAWVRAVDTRRLAWALGAAFLSLAAMSERELYAPLVLVLLVLPVGTFRERLRASVPLFGTLALYVVWRQTLLGGYLGAYGPVSGVLRAPGLLAADVWNDLVGPPAPVRITAAILVLVLLAVAFARRPRALAPALWLALLVIAPLLPLTPHWSPRYSFTPWLLVAIGIGFALRVVSSMRGGPAIAGALLLGVFAPVLAANRGVFSTVVAGGARSRAEGAFFLYESRSGDVLRLPVEASWLFEGLRWLGEHELDARARGDVVYDDLYFVRGRKVTRVFGFSEATRRVEEETPRLAEIREAYRKRIRPEAPLCARVTYGDTILAYTLGPYRTGSYAFLLADNLQRYDRPPTGSDRMVIEHELVIVIRYEAPDGWLAFSDPLALAVRDGRGSVLFERSAACP